MSRLNRFCEWLSNHGFVGVLLMIGFCLGAVLALHLWMSRQKISEADEHEDNAVG